MYVSVKSLRQQIASQWASGAYWVMSRPVALLAANRWHRPARMPKNMHEGSRKPAAESHAGQDEPPVGSQATSPAMAETAARDLRQRTSIIRIARRTRGWLVSIHRRCHCRSGERSGENEILAHRQPLKR